MEAIMVQEKRNFRMHPKLLMDVIQRQAGTLSKAILEGVMNAVDAKATYCHITMDANKVAIQDDGHGFQDRHAIEHFFEVFGQPHDESEGKVYGAFRMGRGQLFAFGKNKWSTTEFRMEVDIQEHGLDYGLLVGQDNVDGCLVEVELYKELLGTQQFDVERDLKLWCKYAPIEVVLNGVALSMDPATEKWDEETDDAYIRITGTSGGSLSIYNLGIHVMDMPAYRLGTAGVVVSKKQLKVNFARNDIQSDCPVWSVLKPLLDQKSAEKAKVVMDDNARKRFADRIKAGDTLGIDVLSSRLITAVNGRHYAVQTLLTAAVAVVVPRGHKKAEIAMQHKSCFAVAQETLERFEVESLEQLVAVLRPFSSWRTYVEVKDLADVIGDLQEGRTVVAPGKWTKREKAWVRLARQASTTMAWAARHVTEDGSHTGKVREVMVGVSDDALAWTDGATFIAFDREFLSQLKFNYDGFARFANVFLHEYCHTNPCKDKASHDHEFYEVFHAASERAIGNFVALAVRRCAKIIQQTGLQVPKYVLQVQDQARGLEGPADEDGFVGEGE